MTTENPQNEQVSAEPQTLREALQQGFDEAQKSALTEEITNQPTEEVETDGVQEERQEEISKEVTEETIEETEVIEAAELSEDDKLAEEVEKEMPLIPNNWSDDEKEAFEALVNSDDEDKQIAAQILLERYNSLKKGFFAKTKAAAEATKSIKEFDDVFAAFDANLKQAGVSRAQYISSLINEVKSLAANPAQKVKELITTYKLSAKDLGFDSYDDDFAYDVDNNQESDIIKELKDQIQSLQTQIKSQPYETQILQFAQAKNENGELLYPHFSNDNSNQVRSIMGGILQSNPNAALDQAYKQAVKALDLEATEQTDDEVPSVDINAIKEKVAKKRKAAQGVKAGGKKIAPSEMSLRDELMSKFGTN